MWVKSEYAGELAVVSAWLAALIPWNVHHSTFGSLGSTLFVRFPFLQIQYSWLFVEDAPGFSQTGVELFGTGIWVADPVTTLLSPGGVSRNIPEANVLWLVGAAILAAAFALSLALYSGEQRVESLFPVDPVRLMGGLLGAGALAFAAATWRLWSSLPGLPLPIGVAVVVLLAITLLTVDRTDTPETVRGDDVGHK
jgi:uncharacterized protein (TIGR04206 family)